MALSLANLEADCGYQVHFVEDRLIPAGHDWMMMRCAERCCLFVRESLRGRDCQSGPIKAAADAAYRKLPQLRLALV